ncbi:MAG: MFS transporter [Candidatus Eisenbacteria sp.]|nr:MFS transporter [Candidatus Eisenbacteria bacterium]
MADQAKRGFWDTIRSYPSTFWVANTMEIFERMAWYGFFAVSSLYITGAVETGGLGFSSEQRGQIQAIVPFFLYLMPVITGALADRYGYKRTFIVAFSVMIVAYYSLGQFHSFGGFLMAFLFVAVGAAIFKPVVVGTVARVTDKTNSSMGFGVFYMMVNIGGFLGPIIAGIVRGWDWKYVFIGSSIWAAVNLILVLTLYREPTTEAASGRGRTFRKVMDDTVEVLGNLRFVLAVFVVLIALMIANQGMEWLSWGRCAVVIVIWLALNFGYDAALRGRKTREDRKPRGGLLQPMRCSNWRFALYLLIMSGFWTSFNQIFLTMPEYIRDYSDTRGMIRLAGTVTRGLGFSEESAERVVGLLAAVDEEPLVGELDLLARMHVEGTGPSEQDLEQAARKILGYKVRVTPERLANLVHSIPHARIEVDTGILDAELQNWVKESESLEIRGAASQAIRDVIETHGPVLPDDALAAVHRRVRNLGVDVSRDQLRQTMLLAAYLPLARPIIEDGRQVNPEYIINLDAAAIILFQVLVSFLMARFHRFTTMIVGMFVAAVGIGLSMLAGGTMIGPTGGSIWVVVAGIVIFAVGEMMASPTSQEYVGRIAPKEKTALYMGYYFVSMALGNLFGGIISGQFYGHFARDLGRPDIMWALFGAIMGVTGVIFLLYDRFAVPRTAERQEIEV